MARKRTQTDAFHTFVTSLGAEEVHRDAYAIVRWDKDGTVRFVRWADNFIEGMAAINTYTETVAHPETGVPMTAIHLWPVRAEGRGKGWDTVVRDQKIGRWGA